jgi:hypothetical protein
VVFHRLAPTAGVAGRCAVVPVGKIKAPVFELPSTIPDEAYNTILPVVSGVITSAVLLDELDDMVVMLYNFQKM